MKIRHVGSSLGPDECRQHLTTFVINDTLAIDAGSLGLIAPLAAQAAITDVLISHSHLDHLASLPMFLDNLAQLERAAPRIHASAEVCGSLRESLFNGQLWPDLFQLVDAGTPFLQQSILRAEMAVTLDGLTIVPVAVDHTVPTLGFLIEDADSAVVFSSDTGPTERLWQLALEPRFHQKLKAVFLECSFPDNHRRLADASGHLCPALFAAEIAKLDPPESCLIVAVHVKSAMFDQTRSELESLGLPNLYVSAADRTWFV